MQIELKAIQQRIGLTFIYVTRDQEEALTMSDRLAVMNAGRVEQVGTPVNVYEQPATDFVAGFIGVSNLFERGGRHFTVRPEKIRMLGEGEAPEPGAHVEGGPVRDVVYVGMVTRYVVELDDGGELAVISQNFESAEQVVQAKARPVRLVLRPDQTVTVREHTVGQPDELAVGACLPRAR